MALISERIEQILAGGSLSEEESLQAVREILAGNVPPAQIASFLTALRARGETTEEIAGFARALRESMLAVRCSRPPVADSCGTGGDGKGTFNISTAAAFVAAGAGLSVAKHGNRSVSSRSGSADVLEALGVKIDMSRQTAERCLNELGVTFLFAPLYHPSMKTVAPVRKEMGIRTLFNLLGPLVNPAGADVQIIGVPHPRFLKSIAAVLLRLQRGRDYSAAVLHEAGYDEIVLSGKAQIAEVRRGTARRRTLTPRSFGLKKSSAAALAGGDAQANAGILKSLLAGERHPLAEVVLANAALLLYTAAPLIKKTDAARAASLDTLPKALSAAREALRSGRARAKLEGLVNLSRSS